MKLLQSAALSGAILSMVQTGSAQPQQDKPQFISQGYAELAECKEFIPIAREINERIVDYIHSPRPNFKCSDFKKVTWDGSQYYSIIRISNDRFCYETYCFTFVYNERANNITFSMDAEDSFIYFHHAREHVNSLDKIMNHSFLNTHDGILLSVPGGSLSISVSNEMLKISTSPSKKGGK